MGLNRWFQKGVLRESESWNWVRPLNWKRIYCYTAGRGDRIMTFIQVQLAEIAKFFYNNLDVVIVAKTAAGLSFRNPFERVHIIANLGIQGIGIMREQMFIEVEM